MIESALDIHRDCPDRFVLDGPTVMVGSRAALSLSLMLHELATNAAKYGALSTADGRVTICWTLSGEGDERVGHVAVERGRRAAGSGAQADRVRDPADRAWPAGASMERWI